MMTPLTLSYARTVVDRWKPGVTMLLSAGTSLGSSIATTLYETSSPVMLFVPPVSDVTSKFPTCFQTLLAALKTSSSNPPHLLPVLLLIALPRTM